MDQNRHRFKLVTCLILQDASPIKEKHPWPKASNILAYFPKISKISIVDGRVDFSSEVEPWLTELGFSEEIRASMKESYQH